MKFTKMQGCGNDYIYVNCFDETVPDPSAAAIRLSDRHFGIGGDGLVLICPSEVADFALGNVRQCHPLCGQICPRPRSDG